MQEFIEQLVQKAGLSHEQAEKVVNLIKENAHKLPELLGGDLGKQLAAKLPGGLGKLFG